MGSDMSQAIGSAGLSSVWYTKWIDGSLEYSKMGIEVYAPLFRVVGVNIQDVETELQHKDVVQKVIDKRAKRK